LQRSGARIRAQEAANGNCYVKKYLHFMLSYVFVLVIQNKSKNTIGATFIVYASKKIKKKD
jgi:hypothetical protein